MDDKVKKSADFILGNKAADLWLYTCDACANEKVIPKRYRYTTGTGLMQRRAMARCEKLERKIKRMLESKQYPGVNPHKAATWSKAVMTVRYMCASWYKKDQERVAREHLDARRR